jgi:pimeloyl-ACP methyl ester carboxylesterase
MRADDVNGVTLALEESDGGRPIVLAHGLTATHRYVVHGSRLLERLGYRALAYDARGHGTSSPAPDPSEYEYTDLVADLEGVLDTAGFERAVLVGASMGAAATLAFALRRPERVLALVQITPAYAGRDDDREEPERMRRWEALADGLEQDGVEGFMRVYGEPPVADRFRSLFLRAVRQRLEQHEHPEAVAAALRVVPRSRPFESLDELDELRVPTLVVSSRDEADPEHPYEVAQAYAERIPEASLVSEEPGKSPLAWRGAALSREIAAFLERHRLGP